MMPPSIRACLTVLALAGFAAWFVAGESSAPLRAQVPARPSLSIADAATAGVNARRLDEARRLLDQLVAEHKIAGAVAAIARRGQLAAVMTSGVQDLTTKVPMSAHSLFRIYSMTKPVTAAAVMMLFEEKRFALTDPVARYLPEFGDVRVSDGRGGLRPPARPITIEDLLLHTSGLNHRTSPEYRDARVRSRAMTLPQFIGNVVRVPLLEDPGTRYRYSESTTVLGRLVEVWSGLPFDRFLEQRLFQPLRMTDTRFAAGPEQRPRLTTVYAPAGDGLRAVELEDVPFTEQPALLEGAVGLLSSVPDFLRFSQFLLGRGELDGVRLLAAPTVDAMVSNGLPPAITTERGGVMGWGLGNVNVVIDPSRVPYPSRRGEYGWDGTAGTIFWIDPDRQLITILMTQSSPANPDRIRQRFKALVEASIDE